MRQAQEVTRVQHSLSGGNEISVKVKSAKSLAWGLVVAEKLGTKAWGISNR